jgi:hypothetical protein
MSVVLTESDVDAPSASSLLARVRSPEPVRPELAAVLRAALGTRVQRRASPGAVNNRRARTGRGEGRFRTALFANVARLPNRKERSAEKDG